MKNKMKALSILASMIMITLLLCAMVSCNNGGGEVESCKHDDPSKIEIVPGVDPTCTDTGLTEGMKCTECDTMVVPQVISQAFGHTEVIDKEAVEPTCTKTGLTEAKHCSVCGVVLISQNTIPTVECVAGNWIIEKEATKSENGSQYKKCVFCGSRLEEEIIPFIGSTGLAYEVNSDGETCTITGKGNCKDTDVLVPCYINGYKVTHIGDWAFFDCTSLTSIVIPDSVTIIGNYAFRDCTSLTSIVIGNSVTSIGIWAFFDCTSLTSIVIPDSVTIIGDEAFEYCYSLTNIVIPDSVTSIGDCAFYYCKSLTNIVIPDSVTSIGNYAFEYCTSLTSIEVDADNRYYKSIDGNLYSKDGKTLIQYSIGNTDASFKVPSGVTSIGNYAFSCCYSLTSVEIGNSVTSIGNSAFRYCESLTSVEIGDSVTSIGESAFYYCTSLTSIEVDADNQYYKSIDGNLYSKDGKTLIKYAIGKTDTNFKVPSDVRIIGDDAFSWCYSLTSVEIGNSVTSIGNYAFSSCTSLTSIVIPYSVTSIGYDAFSWCTSLTSIVIGNGVTSIGDRAFSYCDSLTIYCEAKSKPTGWNNNWNYSNRPVVWGYTVK